MLRDIKEATGWFFYAIVAGILALIAFLVVGFVGVYGFGFFTDATANRQGQTQVKQQINGNGRYRIAAYEKFYNECANVQTDEGQIQALQDELAGPPTPTASRQAVLIPSITALKEKRVDDINTYNADSSKTATAAQFKASDLPFRLYQTDKVTTCHA